MLEVARRAPHLVTQLVPAPNTLEVDPTVQALLADGYVGEVLAVEIQANQGRFVDAEEPLHWRQDAALSGLNVMTMGIWYEALMRWLGPARRVTAMTKIAVPRRKDETGAWQEVRDAGSRRDPGDARRGRARSHAVQHGDGAGAAQRGVTSSGPRGRSGSSPTRSGSRAAGAATRPCARFRFQPSVESAGASKKSSSTRFAVMRRSRGRPSRTACATWSSPRRCR